MPNTITLNVGGTIYESTQDVLCSIPDSYFHSLFEKFNAENVTRDDKERIFVDADGPLFKHILAYLRRHRLPSLNMLKEILNDLLPEADFFGLDGMMAESGGRIREMKAAEDEQKSAAKEVEIAVIKLQDIKEYPGCKILHVFTGGWCARCRGASATYMNDYNETKCSTCNALTREHRGLLIIQKK